MVCDTVVEVVVVVVFVGDAERTRACVPRAKRRDEMRMVD